MITLYSKPDEPLCDGTLFQRNQTLITNGRVVACVQTNRSKDHYARNDAHRPDALFELLPEGGGRVALSGALCGIPGGGGGHTEHLSAAVCLGRLWCESGEREGG